MINFGIDLGTTNSVIAKFVKGTVEVFRNPVDLKDTLPSVVGFRNDRIFLGESARTFQEKDPHSVVGNFKRKMGTTESFKIKSLKGDTKTPIELSSFIIKELKGFVQSGESVEAAVVTIPASFDTIQSNATKEAAYKAGLKQVILLQEPIAASLAYANKVKSEELEEGKWLVYDLGGGTFDVALVKIQDGEMKILDHEGDNYLGGTDFDRLIVEKIIVPYLNEHFGEISLEYDLQSATGKYNALFYKLLKEAEKAKIQLSNRLSAEIEFDFEDEEVFITITRSEFEEIIRSYVDKSSKLIKEILTKNSLTSNDISFVLMVGGSTYIPFVRKRIEELLNVPIKTDIDPATAIAIGAAYYAGTKEKQTDVKQESKNHQISVKPVYEKATKDDEEMFNAKITGDLQGLFYRIRRNDGGFNTGLRNLSERITEDLPLVKDSFNFFSFEILDEHNNLIETNFKEIQIAQNIYTVHGQPLPEDISLELDYLENHTTILEQIFSRNSILPLRSGTKTKTITRSVSKGSESEVISIKVYEGNSNNIPEANKNIGTLEINGKEITRDIVKGAEIEILVQMSESRDLTITAYIPFLDQTFEGVFKGEARIVVDLPEQIQELENKLQVEIETADEREDEHLKKTLNIYLREVSNLQDKAWELADDDVTDLKYQLDDQKRELAQKIDSAVKEKQTAVLIEKYQEIKYRYAELIREAESDQDRKILDNIVDLEPTFVNPPSVLKLKAKIEEIQNLYYSLLWKQPQFLINLFNSIVEEENDYTDPAEAQNLIEEGQIAIISSEFTRLREVNSRLLDLLPSSVKTRIEGKTGIG